MMLCRIVFCGNCKALDFREKITENILARETQKFVMARGPVRAFIFNESRKKSAQAGSNNYPAIEKIHQVINMGLDGGRKIGSEAEATAFGELALSSESKALRHIFFTSTAFKKTEYDGHS